MAVRRVGLGLGVNGSGYRGKLTNVTVAVQGCACEEVCVLPLLLQQRGKYMILRSPRSSQRILMSDRSTPAYRSLGLDLLFWPI